MQPEVHSTYMVWPKNGPKISKIWQKRPKIAKKRRFCTAKFSQKDLSSAYFFRVHLLSLSGRTNLDPKVLSETLFSCRYVWHNIAHFYSQNSIFFTDQDVIKAIAQNWAKTQGPTKKNNKINFEVHGLRILLHLLTLV